MTPGTISASFEIPHKEQDRVFAFLVIGVAMEAHAAHQFARRRIQGAMLDSLRDMDWAPRSLRRLRRDVDAVLEGDIQSFIDASKSLDSSNGAV